MRPTKEVKEELKSMGPSYQTEDKLIVELLLDIRSALCGDEEEDDG